jgi:hypothetical protein
MSYRNPSDTRNLNMGRLSRDITVGEARDFLDKPHAFLRPIKLLKVSRGLSSLLHHEIDYDTSGAVPLEEVLPEEMERRADIGRKMVDEFGSQPSTGTQI